MKTITVDELARNLQEVLDRLDLGSEELLIERDHKLIGRLIPGPGHLTALEAMGDLYGTLPRDAAEKWISDSRFTFGRGALTDEVKDPWAT